MTTGTHQIDVAAAASRLEPLRAALLRALGPELAKDSYFVGGVVRDALLARPLVDLDLASAHDPERLARHLAREFGASAFPLGDSFGCWRIALPADETPLGAVQQIDVCALRGGTIEADLDDRDFTINAFAIAIAASGTPKIIDRHNGLDDLAEGRIRMVSAAAFDSDPLRMIRAVRFAHTLDLDLDEATADAIRVRAPRMTEPAGERVFAELTALLMHSETRRAWRLLDEVAIASHLLPELDACKGMPQSSFHHLDVYEHTLAVLDNCEDIIAAHDFWLPLSVEEGSVPAPVPVLDTEQRLAVLLAALCHDLGKPASRVERPDGRVGFPGHDDLGRDIVDAIADRWRWSNALRGRVRMLVGTHLALGYLLHGPRDARARWRWRRSVAPVAAEAVILSVGDRLATAGVADRRKWVRAHLDIARTLWVEHWCDVRDGAPTPLLDGDAIVAATGMHPGPVIGVVVDALAEAQAIGEVRTHDQALALAIQVVSESTAQAPSPGT